MEISENCTATAWNDIRLMDRHIFFSSEHLGASTMAAAKKTAQALGAKVINTASGGLLIEATPEVIGQVASALPGWNHTVERKTMRIPERTPLQRAKLAARRG